MGLDLAFVVPDKAAGGADRARDWRMLPTRANRAPAAAGYLRRWGETEYRAFVLTVLRVEDGALVEMTAFERPELFPAFGLPLVLD